MKKQPFRIVRVEWDDTTCNSAWKHVDEIEEWARDEIFRTTNIGYLVYEDDMCVVLCGRASLSGEYYGNLERIPRRAITKIEDVCV